MAFYRCDRGLGFDTSNSTGTESDVLYSKRFNNKENGNIEICDMSIIKVGAFYSDVSSTYRQDKTVTRSDCHLFDDNLLAPNISSEVSIYGINGSCHLLRPQFNKKEVNTNYLSNNNAYWLSSSYNSYNYSLINTVYSTASNYLTFFNKNDMKAYLLTSLNLVNFSKFGQNLYCAYDKLSEIYYTLHSQLYDGSFDYRRVVVPYSYRLDPEAYIRDIYSEYIDDSFDYNNYNINLPSDPMNSLSCSIISAIMLDETTGIFRIRRLKSNLSISSITFYSIEGEPLFNISKNSTTTYGSDTIYENLIIQLNQNIDIIKCTEFPYYNFNIIEYDYPYLLFIDISSNLIVHYNVEDCNVISSISVNNITYNDFKLINNLYLLVSNYTQNSKNAFVYKYTKNLEKISEWSFIANSIPGASAISVKSINRTFEPSVISDNNCTLEVQCSTDTSSTSGTERFYINYNFGEQIVEEIDSIGSKLLRMKINSEKNVYQVNRMRINYYLSRNSSLNLFSFNNLRINIDNTSAYVKIYNNYYQYNNSNLSNYYYYINYFDNTIYVWKHINHSGYVNDNTVIKYQLHTNILYLLNNYNEINIINIDSSNESYTDYYFN